MNHSLEHLPAPKQRYLAYVVELIRAAVDVEMLILYGSHARGDWVEDRKTGYYSDFDILVIVASPEVAEDFELWSRLDDRLDRTAYRNRVQLIAHDIAFVNRQLEDGWYFFVDVEKEGVMLYDSGRHTLAEPRPKTRAERRVFAQKCFQEFFETADDFYSSGLALITKGRYKVAAFQLHQATEHYYKCAIIVITTYWPMAHNIKYLGRMAAGLDPAFHGIFPVKPRVEKRRLELLKEAYVKARYSLEWTISREDLEVLAQRIAVLRDRTRAVCEAYIDSLAEPPA